MIASGFHGRHRDLRNALNFLNTAGDLSSLLTGVFCQFTYFIGKPEALPEDASSVDTMRHALKTKHGRAAYALHKQTVEPVFGTIKSVMGFHQFLLRGLENVQIEWTLVCMAWNLKRMTLLRPQQANRTDALRFHRKTTLF
jgi:hypothetical protein